MKRRRHHWWIFISLIFGAKFGASLVNEWGDDVQNEGEIDEKLRNYQKYRAQDDDDFSRQKRAFGKKDYLLPENFKTLKRNDIPVTYRLHDDLLRYYRKGTRPVTHPNNVISVSMSVFLYQIVKLDAVKNTISLSGSFELVSS
ncbi:unnamed protein product [Caenorhabditis angaria]|uniref:Neurotransmitter-gated ion-channel ligand-binding domain-containing protein n=1 Tax=Caenorhabditis angaria TaxID=860376 RepID=A0A9P1ITH6_9PELO|nr:unnamed protein product [Caenorhabditis angaria]